jgi:hypothetical protein
MTVIVQFLSRGPLVGGAAVTSEGLYVSHARFPSGRLPAGGQNFRNSHARVSGTHTLDHRGAASAILHAKASFLSWSWRSQRPISGHLITALRERS